MHTNEGAPTPARRRQHSEEFKARVVEACRGPGVSMAAVALANSLNANLLRRWVRERNVAPAAEKVDESTPPQPATTGEFVPLQLLTPAAAPAHGERIQVEVRRGATTVSVSWPAEAAEACSAWLRSWLR